MPTAYQPDQPTGVNNDTVPAVMDGSVNSLLAQVPPGTEFDPIRFAIQRIATTFPDKLPEITPERITGWITEVSSGDGRTGQEIRNDMFTSIVSPTDIQTTLGVDEKTAADLASGATSFSDFFTTSDSGGVVTGPGTTAGKEDKAKTGVGGGGPDPKTQLTILTAKKMDWYFDESSGKWYVGYGLPNSNRTLLFEARPEQLDALFGLGKRPVDFTRRNLTSLLGENSNTFGGNISAMEGKGSFESEVQRVTALGLDEGVLPEWAKQDKNVLDLVYIAQAEGKSQDWLLSKISETAGFKSRFPGIKKLQADGNLTLKEAIGGFLEFEAGVKASIKSIGQDPGTVTPPVIAGLLKKGYSLTTVSKSVQVFDRMQKYAPAMQAFNSILAEQNKPPITDIQDMFDFVAGTAPADIYDVWEASSFAEAASKAGLSSAFSAEDAMAFALETEGATSLADATSGFQSAAQLLLKFRREVDLNQFSINQEDLIDLALGRAPQSGTSAATLQENLQRAVSAARKSLSSQVKPFVGFTPSGTPKAQSLSNLREGS